MKTIYHVPIEQFGFIEIEDSGWIGLSEIGIATCIRQYRAISEAAKQQSSNIGIPDAEFREIYDEFFTSGSIIGDPGIIEKMSKEQQKSINDLKKAFKRHI